MFCVIRQCAIGIRAFLAGLMGMFEKRRFKKFLIWVQNFDINNKATYEGMDPNTHTMQQVHMPLLLFLHSKYVLLLGEYGSSRKIDPGWVDGVSNCFLVGAKAVGTLHSF